MGWTLRTRARCADAGALFDGPRLTREDNRFAYPEPRFQTYGWLGDRLVLLVWTPTPAGLRVISMRHCHEKEARRVIPRLG